MSKKAMNLNKRSKPAVKDNNALIAWFKKHGWFVITGPWQCDVCAEEMMMGAQSVGYSGTDTPPWGNAKCALRFKKNGATVAACRCGWRKAIKSKFTPKSKPHCISETCNATLSEKELKDNGGYCWNCKPYDPIAAAMKPHLKVCNRKNCNNPVPPERKDVCYACIPPSTKATTKTKKEKASKATYNM